MYGRKKKNKEGLVTRGGKRKERRENSQQMSDTARPT